jgi:hypothetical protein
LQERGRFSEALAELERGHELGSRQIDWRQPSDEWVKEARRLVALEAKLPAFLRGEAEPADTTDRLDLAEVCNRKQLYAAAARYWREAFAADPKLADDMVKRNRYNAACIAALAATDQGKDDPPPDETARNQWRAQALDWLRADLARWTRLIESDEPADRDRARQALQHWRHDSDLAGIRDEASLAKLSEEERKPCLSLWVDVNALLSRARGEPPPPPPPPP